MKFFWYVAAAIAAVFLILLVTPMKAHEWYPADCCSGFDCYPIDDTAVEITDTGWLIVQTGEVIKYGQRGRPSERESKDGQFHRCSVGGDPNEATLCLFVPAIAS